MMGTAFLTEGNAVMSVTGGRIKAITSRGRRNSSRGRSGVSPECYEKDSRRAV
ncbi:MAG: hypothetical protein ACLUUO_01590 [Sellimonas intestinalis]